MDDIHSKSQSFKNTMNPTTIAARAMNQFMLGLVTMNNATPKSINPNPALLIVFIILSFYVTG